MPGLFIDPVDQGFADAFSARGLAGEHKPGIADRFDGRGAAVEQIVGQAEQLSAALRDKPMDRFIRVEKARPRHPGNVSGKCSCALLPVERVVAVPQRKPLVVVLPGHKADSEIVKHSFVRESGIDRAAPERPRASS